MTLESALSISAAAATALLALFALFRDRRPIASWAFAAGMLVFAVREALSVKAVGAFYESDIERWHRWRLLAEGFLPALWLVFSLTYARIDPRRFLTRWSPVIAVAFVAPLGIAVFGWRSLAVRDTLIAMPNWLVPVGGSGYALHVVLLLAAVLVLVNLESTLRAASGAVRWQIKFSAIGLGALFGVQVFLYSQVLLYSSIQTTLFPFGSGALLLASSLIIVTLVRARLAPVNVYLSEAFLYNSLTLIVVGIYLLVVAGLVELIDEFAGAHRTPFVAFVVLVAVVGLALVLLSNELQLRVKRFLSRHLKRPTYDYRQIWDDFTRRTSSIVEMGPLSAALSAMAAETFGCAAATIWRIRDGERRLSLGGSTAWPWNEAGTILAEFEEGRPLIDLMARLGKRTLDARQEKLTDNERALLQRFQARYVVTLTKEGDEPIGFLTLNDRITGQQFNTEDFSLMETFADQSAAALENRRLTREVQRAKEMETFQSLSAFFVHDLKNLASRLSLAMQNLPVHFDKPEFRNDLLDTMAKSVAKIDAMTARLSAVTRGLELQRVYTDLNELVHETLATLNGTMEARVARELHDVPRLRIDPEQIQKVLNNLLLNANEAVGDEGRITVRTSRENGWVLLSVSDDGCGMSEEFMARSLFKPFQTTKKQGLGIGLFHSKTIVEAHSGRIEVESRPGKGTTFRVLLPVSD